MPPRGRGRPRRVPEMMTTVDFLETINDSLKEQAREPNVYAYVPHDKQYLFHKSTAPEILYIGGNRSGKTVGGAVETVYRLLGQHPYKKVEPAPVRGRAVAVDFNYGVDMIMIPKIRQYLPPSYLHNGSWEDSYDKEHRLLTLTNKSFLEFRSYEQSLEKFAGTSRHFTWYDEEPPKPVYNECQARLVDVNGHAFITMTPIEGMTWVHGELYEPAKNGKRSDVFVIEIDMAENPHIPREAAERYLAGLDPEERKARGKGQFIALGGLVFKMFNKDTHIIDFEIPPKSWQWFVSIDHGFNNPTAILWHAVSPDNEIITFSEHYQSEMIVSEHAAIIKDRNGKFGKEPEVITGDPAMAQRNAATGTSMLQEYADNGIYIAPGSNDIDSGINRMISYLKVDPMIGRPRWRITANCVNLIREMPKLRWASYTSAKIRSDRNKQEKIHKKDDHACDSARYFFTFMPDLTPYFMEPGFEKNPNPLNAPVNRQSWDRLASAVGGFTTADEPKTNWDIQYASELYEYE